MAIFLIVTSLPYLWAEILTPPGRINSGFMYDYTLDDAYSYIAKMREGQEGSWLYTNRFTTEEQKPVLLFVFYIVLGHVARITGMSLILTYHVARVISSACVLLAIDRLIRLIELPLLTRMLCLVFAVMAQGVGWLFFFVRTDILPVEFWVTEAMTFQTLMQHPHIALSSAAMFSIFAELLIAARRGATPGRLAWIGAQAFILSWLHPRMILIPVAVGAAAALIGARRGQWTLRPWIVSLTVILIAGVPPGLLMYLSVGNDPLWAKWSATPTPTPTPIWLLEAYGLLWPLALLGAYGAWRSGSAWGTFLVCWLVVGVLLPHIPTISQRRLMQGLNLPLALLSAWWIGELLLKESQSARAPSRTLRIAAAVPLCLIPLFTPFFYVKEATDSARHGRYPPYYPRVRENAFEYLRGHSRPNDVVLCSYISGRTIPALTGNRVVIGHWAETVDAGEKVRRSEEFFKFSTTAERRRELLDRFHVRYLLYTKFERDLGSYDPGNDPTVWRKVWGEQSMAIYERIG